MPEFGCLLTSTWVARRLGVATRLKIQGPIRPCHTNLTPRGQSADRFPRRVADGGSYIVGQHAN